MAQSIVVLTMKLIFTAKPSEASVTDREPVDASVGQHHGRIVFIERQTRHRADET